MLVQLRPRRLTALILHRVLSPFVLTLLLIHHFPSAMMPVWFVRVSTWLGWPRISTFLPRVIRKVLSSTRTIIRWYPLAQALFLFLFLTRRPLLPKSASRSPLQACRLELGRNLLLEVVKSILRFLLPRPARLSLILLPGVRLLRLLDIKVCVACVTLRLLSFA